MELLMHTWGNFVLIRLIHRELRASAQSQSRLFRVRTLFRPRNGKAPGRVAHPFGQRRQVRAVAGVSPPRIMACRAREPERITLCL